MMISSHSVNVHSLFVFLHILLFILKVKLLIWNAILESLLKHLLLLLVPCTVEDERDDV